MSRDQVQAAGARVTPDQYGVAGYARAMTDGLTVRGRIPFLTRAFVVLSAFYFLVFALGYQLLPVVPLHLRALGASLAESGRFTSAFTLGSAGGALFTGSLGDRLGQRRVLIWSCLLSAAFFGIYALLNVRWALYLLAPLHGLVWSGLRTATMAKAGSLMSDETRAEGMSIFGLAAPAGVAAGPILGLAFWPILGFHGLMAGLGIAFLGLFALIHLVPAEPLEARRQGPLLQRPEAVVRVPAAILFLLGVSFGPIPPFATQEARALGFLWPSAMMACLAAGMVGLRFILGLRGMGRDPIRILPWTLALTALGMVLMALLPGGTWRHVLGGLVYGGGYGISHTLMFMTIIEISRPGSRGAGVGMLYFSYDVGQAAGAFLVGHVMEWSALHWSGPVGYRMGWGLAAVALALCVGLSGKVVRAGSRVR
jgi:MFS family permease